MSYLNITCFLLFTSILFGQVEEVGPPNYIKTINFKSNTPQSELPVLELGEYLTLNFDVLNGDEADYYYKITHHNYDWTPSVLMKSEYLDGFDNQRIRDYENSFNTYQIYSHYKLTIPNQFTKRLLVSGNYIISIYNEDDALVFSRKFMIFENNTNVGINIKRSRSIEHIETKQRVDLKINSSTMRFNNPKQTIKVLIVQNNNLNTAISGLKPLFTVGNDLIYKYDHETSFWGGNEYLAFENKDIRAPNTGVQFIDLKEIYHGYLFENFKRANSPYTYNPDINGNFLITQVDADNVNIEADYAWMHFTLRATPDLKHKNIHVYGNFNNYEINEQTKLNFDQKTNLYTNALLLKQGFYNYKYIIVNQDQTINEGAVSGNFYQTENNYKVLVYYKDLGARYDRIIGFGEGTSLNISN